jgi:hypothetical protein
MSLTDPVRCGAGRTCATRNFRFTRFPGGTAFLKTLRQTCSFAGSNPAALSDTKKPSLARRFSLVGAIHLRSSSFGGLTGLLRLLRVFQAELRS